MTDEEKAIEYVLNTYYVKDTTEKERIFLRDEIKFNDRMKINAYLAGLEEGKTKWHDLRKNPEDVPKRKTYVLGINHYNRYEVCCNEVGDEGESYWHDISHDICDPIAWCELPKFEVEK